MAPPAPPPGSAGAQISPPAPAPLPGPSAQRPRPRVHPAAVACLAAALAALLVTLATFVAARMREGRNGPAAAARALGQARAIADQDAIALFPQAREAVRAALAAAPRASSGEARALAAEIEIAWADALEEREDEHGARAHLDAALVEAEEGVRANPASPDAAVALADYHRARRAAAEMERELGRAGSLRADPGRVALVQGLALGQRGALNRAAGDAGRAAALLRRAAEAFPQSARVHYKLAQALAAQHKEEEAVAELKETIRLSPSHERARAQLATMASPRRRTDP